MKGRIFNIQRYSIEDGPGIRTTVFLKGCPLRCRWCANPESWAVKPVLFYSKTKCIGCRMCVKAAKHGEVTVKEGCLVINREICSSVMAQTIAAVCTTNALSVQYEEVTAKETVERICRDLPFYEKSGGGVTFSGGEPLLQSEFLLEVLKLCKKKNISTAVETTGMVPWSAIETVLEYVDLFLYDLKHTDSDKHREGTGVRNEQIIANLKKLQQAGACIHVRIPVIPGFNDDRETMEEMAKLLDEIQIEQRSLLPFHQYGSSKYRSLGLPYEMEGISQLKESALEEWKKVVKTT